MEYVVLKTGGKQYKVSKGSVIDVEKINAKKGEEIELKDILLYVSDDKMIPGSPLVEKAAVKATVVDQYKSDKIRVAKFKAKAKYRRVAGYRKSLTKLKITSIKVPQKTGLTPVKK
jgi:large subunit ribosomal protein L21